MKENKKELLIKFNKENIINAAKELFIEKGIEKTTMDEIAKRAEYSKSTIYVYFKSKDEIYSYIVYEAMCSFRDAIEESINKCNNFKDKFFSICSCINSFQEKYPKYFEDIIGEIEVSDGSIEKMPVLKDIYNVGEEINNCIIKFLKEGIDENIVREDIELLPTVFSIWADICGNIIMSYKKEEYISKVMKKTRKEFLDYSFNLIYKSITN